MDLEAARLELCGAAGLSALRLRGGDRGCHRQTLTHARTVDPNDRAAGGRAGPAPGSVGRRLRPRLTAAPEWIHDRPVGGRDPALGAAHGSVARHAKGEALELIVRELRDEILDGRLRPGERIHQQAVAERFGTSRLPVREALRQLQHEGLVVVLPNAGARVARLDQAELVEVYLLRERLEPLAIELSAPGLRARRASS